MVGRTLLSVTLYVHYQPCFTVYVIILNRVQSKAHWKNPRCGRCYCGSSATQEIPRTLRNLKPIICPYPEPFYSTSYYLPISFKFTLILSFNISLISSNRSFSFQFFHKIPLCTTLLLLKCYMSSPYNSPRHIHSNDICAGVTNHKVVHYAIFSILLLLAAS